MDWLTRWQEMKKINDEIKKLQKEILKLQEVVSDYQTCQSDINLQCVYWDNRYKTYTGLELYSSIWKKDQFEGQAAEELCQMVPEAVREIELMKNLMEKVSAEIRNQIILIEEHITELREKISGLRDQLAAYQ